MTTRKIIHVDMDAFFAQVEQRDHPHLRGQAVVVGGTPEGRGVVAAASYEARAFGVKSAMSMAQALRRCPQVCVRPCDFSRYQAVSQALRAIFARYTDVIEPLSLDEAYLDVTDNKVGERSATRIAVAIRADVRRELDLTCSAGVAPVKFVAKIASDVNKPDGLCVVPPAAVFEFLSPLPVQRIPGIGPATTARLQAIGIQVIADLRSATDEQLAPILGSAMTAMRQRALGIDERPVVSHRTRKSVGIEDTFAADIDDPQVLDGHLMRLAEGLVKRCARAAVIGRCLTLKVRYHDFTTITRSHSPGQPLEHAQEIQEWARVLLARTAAGQQAVRLLGLSLSNLIHLGEKTAKDEDHSQLTIDWD